MHRPSLETTPIRLLRNGLGTLLYKVVPTASIYSCGGQLVHASDVRGLWIELHSKWILLWLQFTRVTVNTWINKIYSQEKSKSSKLLLQKYSPRWKHTFPRFRGCRGITARFIPSLFRGYLTYIFSTAGAYLGPGLPGPEPWHQNSTIVIFIKFC